MKDFIEILDRRFGDLHSRSQSFICEIPESRLFTKGVLPFGELSCGGHILRSAGKVEQTFGGITTRLWDDPIEWSLPEELSNAKKILEYLDEVEATRKKGFAYFVSDQDLKKEIPAPVEMKSVFALILETIIDAEKYHHLAIAANRAIASKKRS